MALDPLRPQVTVEKLGELRRDPGWGMDSIGHVCDWNRVFLIRPDVLPHSPGHPSVQFTDAISPARHAEREHGHVERSFVGPEIHEFLPRESKLIPVAREVPVHHFERECIVSGSDRSVRRKDGRGLDLFRGLVEFLALQNTLSNPFQNHEGRVPFVGVKDRGLAAESPENTDTTYSQYNF